MEQAGSRSPGDREQTPEFGGEEPGGEQPQPKPEDGQKPDGEQPKPSDGRPDSPHASNDVGQNDPGVAPDSATGAAPANPSGTDVWGNLPARKREIFRVKGGDDMPSEYRDWIDAYYRRLNRASEDL